MDIKHVDGINKGTIFLYALSTCIWCKRTKSLLNDLGLEYSFIDVDLLEGEERASVKRDLKKWNENGSFPTIVIDEERVLINYQEDEIRRLFGNG
ncbi:glutaredoxin family protein [Candidatus Latescibacterota bacterium]